MNQFSPFTPRQTRAAPAAAIAALIVFAILAYAVQRGETQRLDVAIYRHFQAHPSAWVHTNMTGITFLGGGAALTVWAVLGVVAWVLRPDWRLRALSLLLGIGGGEGVVNGLKALFPRPRPSPVWAHLGSSFPSGHALFAVTVYGMLAYWASRPGQRPWVWPLAVALMALIGFSRVYLGVHYASDVAAGYAAGLPWLWTCLALPPALARQGRAKR